MRLVADLASEWKEWIDRSWLEEIDQTPFLARCRAGDVSEEQLRTFLQQHYFYSRQFTRYLTALISNLEQEGDRERMLDNLFEEMGLRGPVDIPHARLYRNLIDRLHIDVSETALRPGTRALIDHMLASCRSDHRTGLGALCLGAEAAVAHLYSQVLVGMEARGWSDHDMHFFDLHVETDDGHAGVMLAILEREARRDPAARAVIRESGRRALAARAVFMRGLQ